MLVSAPSSAYSNDPAGEMFIARSFGDFSNCGPILALMLDKYVKPETESGSLANAITVARKMVQKDNGGNVSNRWWRISDIKSYLNHKKIKYNAVDTGNLNNLKRQNRIIDEIKQGGVVVINVNMNDLPLGIGSGVGKPYFTVPFIKWGHFLAITGYKEVNGRVVYEVHDSYTTKGKNRLYYANNINKAINSYNRELVFVRNTPSIDNTFKLSSIDALNKS